MAVAQLLHGLACSRSLTADSAADPASHALAAARDSDRGERSCSDDCRVCGEEGGDGYKLTRGDDRGEVPEPVREEPCALGRAEGGAMSGVPGLQGVGKVPSRSFAQSKPTNHGWPHM